MTQAPSEIAADLCSGDPRSASQRASPTSRPLPDTSRNSRDTPPGRPATRWSSAVPHRADSTTRACSTNSYSGDGATARKGSAGGSVTAERYAEPTGA